MPSIDDPESTLCSTFRMHEALSWTPHTDTNYDNATTSVWLTLLSSNRFQKWNERTTSKTEQMEPPTLFASKSLVYNVIRSNRKME